MTYVCVWLCTCTCWRESHTNEQVVRTPNTNPVELDDKYKEGEDDKQAWTLERKQYREPHKVLGGTKKTDTYLTPAWLDRIGLCPNFFDFGLDHSFGCLVGSPLLDRAH